MFGTFCDLGSSGSKIFSKPLVWAGCKDAAVLFFLQSLCTSDGPNFVGFSEAELPMSAFFQGRQLAKSIVWMNAPSEWCLMALPRAHSVEMLM